MVQLVDLLMSAGELTASVRPVMQAEDKVKLLSAAPRLLLQDAASMRTRLVFLLQHRGKPPRDVIQDVVR
jgi:hypothetical protein